ncbi:GNAT family N-acetyltransferase [Georgenia sp. TF02-10]|uniref:GNAT family N-acetyltransferase n=1 Tax=Georgenia sp. TF02-10 TaxID=2917725 RepID=UPI001FA728A7|nr:GNAT family protein [Georgenia sp. TF02-10]UNX54904.1 GNAT family N-acetyltransferase [Georgenia sp. TF02-10]
MSVPDLRGARVHLRDWRPADVDDRLRDLLASQRPWHRTNGPYFGSPTAEDMARVADGLASVARTDPARRGDPRETLPIVLDARVVGSVSWYWEDQATDWRRMGVVVYDETLWGRGIATEALALWTSYLFAATDAQRLDFATYSGNPGMLAVGRRLGFTEEARLRRARRWAGGVHDAVVMGVLREEWEGSAWGRSVRTGPC